MNQLGKPHGAVGVSDYDGIISPAYFVANIASAAEPRFVHYLLRTRLYISEYERRGKYMPPSQFDISWPDFRSIQVVMPPIGVQQRIADYLDREMAQIDEIIAAKRRLAELLIEEEQRLLLDLVGDWRSVQTWSLRQSGTSVLTGPFGTQLAATEYVEGGIPVVNPTHISKIGEIVPDRQVTLSEEVATRLSRHRLHHGDIVMGRKGDVGRSAVVKTDQEGWVCGSDSIAIRTDPAKLDPQFLAKVLHVMLYRQQLEAYSTGAMMANVNEGTLLAFRIPKLSLNSQNSILEQIRGKTNIWRKTYAFQMSSIELLQERRQALIIAAVTGQLEISDAA